VASYEYGNLYALKISTESDPIGNPIWGGEGCLIETQGRRSAEYVGAWGTNTLNLNPDRSLAAPGTGIEVIASRLAIMNELGAQGWVIHQQVRVDALGPDWMLNLFKAQIQPLLWFGTEIFNVWHVGTQVMMRRRSLFSRSGNVSATRLGGVDLTPAR
jgi:hypothetical protein